MPNVSFVFRTDIRGRYQGQLIVNTFLWKVNPVLTTPPIVVSNQTRADYLQAAFIEADSHVRPFIITYSVDQWQQESTTASLFSWTRSERIATSSPRAVTGDQATPGLPSGVCGIIARRTLLQTGRTFRSRLACGALPVNETAIGSLVPGGPSYTAMQGLANYLTLPHTVAWNGVVWSCLPIIARIRGEAPASGLVAYEPVGRTYIRLALGTQRTRIRGHGRRG